MITSSLAKVNSFIDGKPVEFWSMNANNGSFGFLNPECAYTAFVPFGLFSTVCGNAGYIVCLVFFSPIVVSSSFLMEPLFA
jgi:hypothetical protein